MCKTNSMLVANFGTYRPDINMSDPWWLDTIAASYNVYLLSNYWDMRYNGTGTDHKVSIARELKKRNPRIKIMFYQPADRLGDTEYVMNALMAHPEWWLRDDNGNLVPFGGRGKRPQIDPSVPGARAFFANLSISLFDEQGEAARGRSIGTQRF